MKEQALRDAVKLLAKISINEDVSSEGNDFLSRAAMHLMTQIYGNGYWVGTQSQVDRWKVQK